MNIKKIEFLNVLQWIYYIFNYYYKSPKNNHLFIVKNGGVMRRKRSSTDMQCVFILLNMNSRPYVKPPYLTRYNRKIKKKVQKNNINEWALFLSTVRNSVVRKAFANPKDQLASTQHRGRSPLNNNLGAARPVNVEGLCSFLLFHYHAHRLAHKMRWSVQWGE